MDKFDFYGLRFKDRETYQHYKEIKRAVNSSSSRYVKGFRLGIDEHCLKSLERQFRADGYYVDTTYSYPVWQYDRETEKEQQYVYLTVGASLSITDIHKARR